VLDPHFTEWANPEAAGKVLASLAEAAFTGSPSKAEKAVRDAVQVEVALHDNPAGLGNDVLRLPRCRLHPGVFSKFVRERKARVWQIVVDRNPSDDWKPQVECLPMAPHSNQTWMPGGYFILHPDWGSYDSEFGLRLGIRGRAARTRLTKKRPQDTQRRKLKPECWQAHVREVVQAFEKHILPKERFAFDRLAAWLQVPPEKLELIARLVLIFHDLGKLSREWQRIIQEGLEPKPGCFLAHRGDGVKGKLPAHATVSAWVVTPCILRLVGVSHKNTLVAAARSAIAHHHSVRAAETPPFDMPEGWFSLVRESLRELAGEDVTDADFNTTSPCGGGHAATFVPDLTQEKRYVPYLLFSRWLRLSDRIATGGGEDAVLRYEEWFGAI
jgi:CRISPR-associated endonuclease Cas3-HD